MCDSKIKLSLLIILHVFLLMAAYHFANAQPSTEPPASSYGLYTDFNPSMAIVIVVIICAFFFVGFLSIYMRNCSESTTSSSSSGNTSNDRARRRGLDPAAIETFPIFVYSVVKEIKIGRGALECAVCLSEFEDDDTLRLLPKCDHVFHPDCIDAWLASHVTCPVCRANLTTPDQSSENNAKNTPPPPPPAPPPQIIESHTESNQVNQDPLNEIVINVNEDHDHDHDHQLRARISGKFPRSHSTGHSLVQPGENTERYTLRLPEEIRKQMIFITNTKLKRTMSFDVVLPTEGSSRKGLDRQWFDRWVFLMTPPFVSKAGSAKVPLNCLNVKVEQVEESAA